MARTDTLPHFLTDVADAIREKTGESGVIQASAFDTAISNIPSGGGYDWASLGFDEAPKDIQQAYNYSVIIQNTYEPSTNLRNKYLNDTNLVYFPIVDTSMATDTSGMFSSCTNLKEIAPIDTSSSTTMTEMFRVCSSLTKIPQLNASNVSNIRNAFASDSALKDFGGLLNIGQAYSTSTSANNRYYTIDLSNCTLLTHDSLMNIINSLYDIAGKGCQIQTLNLGSTNTAKLTSEEIAIATNKGWNVT